MKNGTTICYFGIYDPDLGRNRIFMKGFRENGASILECRDNSRGFLKFIKLFLKHRKIKNKYDFLVVGYPGHIAVWLAKFISRKPVVFDALSTMHEGVILSRNQVGRFGLKNLYVKFIDWLAVKCADFVLLESQNQKKYFEQKFGKSEKFKIIYTGADDGVFYRDVSVPKKEKFTVVFRGKFLPEAGVKYVIKAAKLLEGKGIDFLIMGNGFLEKEIKKQIAETKCGNLTLISEYLSFKDIREKMLSCHISLGQFEDHQRLKRTIPHKCFESLAMGLPYITARALAVSEILEDGKNGLFVNPADPEDLAKKILEFKGNPKLDEIGDSGRKLFLSRFSPRKLAEDILSIFK